MADVGAKEGVDALVCTLRKRGVEAAENGLLKKQMGGEKGTQTERARFLNPSACTLRDEICRGDELDLHKGCCSVCRPPHESRDGFESPLPPAPYERGGSLQSVKKSTLAHSLVLVV